MEISFNPRDWAHVPVWLWPVVWWRLIWLRAHLRASGRGALYRIQPDGRIQVYLSPDETDGTAWLYQQSQLWRDHWTPMQDKSGEAHLGSIRYWTPRFMERGHLTNFISRRTGFPVAPAIEDSS